MNTPTRRTNLGHLQLQGSKLVYENTRVKGYGNSPSLVPQNTYCLTGVILDNITLIFGDKLGDLVFLCAISLPTDRDGLPTALLCMDADKFVAWASPTASDIPTSEPTDKHFCLCAPSDFLENHSNFDQIELLQEAEIFKEALKKFIIYILKLKRNDPTRAETLLGIAKANDTSTQPTQKSNSEGKTDLTEAEKEALMNKDGKKSDRLAGKNKTYYGVGQQGKIPIGSISVTVPSTKRKGNEPADPPKVKYNKNSNKDSTVTTDLKGRTVSAETEEDQIRKPNKSRGPTKAQLQDELEAIKRKQAQRSNGNASVDNPTSNRDTPVGNPTTSVTNYSVVANATSSNGISNMASAVSQAQIIVNNNSAASRDSFRDQESKDFFKAIAQTQQIIGIARGYVTDLVQFNRYLMSCVHKYKFILY
jgi:hypothetical protein